MFTPKTERIAELANQEPHCIEDLKKIFIGKTIHYIDYSNVLPWSEKLHWHIQPKRLKQLLDSFDNICVARLYQGTLIGDRLSENFIKEVIDMRYTVTTKPVKIMKHSIDVTRIPIESIAVIKQFIRKPFLRILSEKTIGAINGNLQEMNQNGVLTITDRKCNFDVEIGRDILTDFQEHDIESFILWSNDSDFADPVRKLLRAGKRVVVITTSGMLSRELSELTTEGLYVFDIKKIRNFVCRTKEVIEVIG